MSTKLLITIDTECDNGWAQTGKVTTENAGYLPRFQQLAEKFGFKPTYLAAYEMALDRFFIDFAKDALKRSTCEIGSHLHPWNTPPAYKLTSDDNKFHPLLVEYPENIIHDKVKFLTDFLEDTLGRKIVSHRAGRWAFNAAYAKILCRLGYKVDCSVTPLEKLPPEKRPQSEPQAPFIDYTNCPADAYFLNSTDISIPGDSPLLEIPMTTMQHYGKIKTFLLSIMPGNICKNAFRMFFGRPVYWFRPHSFHKQELSVVAECKVKQQADYIMFMLHSSEFMPGSSPVFKTEKQVERMYEDIEQVFEFLSKNNVQGATCSEYYDLFKSQKQNS